MTEILNYIGYILIGILCAYLWKIGYNYIVIGLIVYIILTPTAQD